MHVAMLVPLAVVGVDQHRYNELQYTKYAPFGLNMVNS